MLKKRYKYGLNEFKRDEEYLRYLENSIKFSLSLEELIDKNIINPSFLKT